ncbi:MAG: cation transporter [Bacteroidetes bacterium]|nr:MAG: cation transporter [Bacteroidota bacterium]
MESRKALIRFHGITVIIGFLLLLFKFLAYFSTHSNAILTDALESIVNVVAGSLAWYSLWLSTKPKDHEHPYGHGKVEFISASVEGSLIGIAGLIIVGKSAYNFFVPQEIHSLDLGLYITAGAGLVNFLLGYYLVVKGKREKSLAIQANGEHLKSDAYSSLGLVIGLGLVLLTGSLWIDNAMGLLFGGLILFQGLKILRRSIAGIMDEADFELLEEIVTLLDKEKKDNWIDIHNLRVIKYGHHLHIDCHVTLPWYYSLQEAHDIISEMDKVIQSNYDQVELFIHMDPCIELSCRICPLECKERKHPFEERLDWTLKRSLANQKHAYSD